MISTDQPMLARRQLRLAIVGCLKLICDTVESPGIWPTSADMLPVLLVNVPSEMKTSVGRNVPEFTTSASVVIQGQVSSITPGGAQDAIEDLAYQVENAVLEDYAVNLMIQQFVSVQTETEITSDGKQHLAGYPMIAPAAGSVWPIVATPTVPAAGVNLHLDAANVFDPTGTYPNPTFPTSVQPAPRTSGPDGRDEGYSQINLPQ